MIKLVITNINMHCFGDFALKPAMTRVCSGHHVLGVEHLLGQLGNCAGTVLGVASGKRVHFGAFLRISSSEEVELYLESFIGGWLPGNQGGKSRHEEM